MSYPKISIVTPSYNQGEFLEQTILSVLGQNYPNLEYIIIDGNSTDNSVEIIKKYEKHLKYWVSEPDNGQSEAINKGFSYTSGEILAWINSDDMYLPGVFNLIIEHITPKKIGILFGNCIHISHQNNKLLSHGSDVVSSYHSTKLEETDFIIQPSSFWTRETWLKVGKLNEDMHYGFDWEWFLRAKKINIPFYPISKPISIYRIHDAHKTGTGGIKRQREISQLYSQYNLRISSLYDTLCNEKMNSGSFTYKLYSLLSKSFFRKATIGSYLKIVKFPKYKRYSVREINLTNQMI